MASTGGTLDEVPKYLSKPDLPNDMWEWQLFSDVKTIAGMSAVVKKDNFTQRALMMAVPLNFLCTDVRERSKLGMEGGALTRLHSESGCWDAAICDQSQAFTKLLVPAWLRKCQAAPPLPAKLVFHLLPALMQASVSPETLVCACYMRLAMGCSHAFIL